MNKKIFSLFVLLMAAVSGAWALPYDFTLTTQNADHCTITFSVGTGESLVENVTGANENDLVTVTITPDENWAIGSVTATTFVNLENAGARRMEQQTDPYIPVLGDVTLTEVTDAEVPTWTFKMPSANVKVGVKYDSGLAWNQGETAVGTTVTYYKGIDATIPVLNNPKEQNFITTIAPTNNGVSIDSNGKLTVYNQVAAGNSYTITTTFSGNETYEGKTLTFTLVIADPVTLTVEQDANGTVTVEDATNVAATANAGKYSVIPNTNVTLKSSANAGYYTNGWGVGTTATTVSVTNSDYYNVEAQSQPATSTLVVTINEQDAKVTPIYAAREYNVDLTVTGDDEEKSEKEFWSGKVDDGEYQNPFPITAKMGQTLTAKYEGTRKVKSVRAVVYDPKFAVPLTLEATTDGTIVVSNPRSGMQYSLNDGEKKTMSGDSYTIPVSIGDKVAFYGDGTNITTYFVNTDDYTQIAGTAKVKVYGNIMSLVDEDGFAIATTLATNAFGELFKGNKNLTDASRLLLPATKLATNCYYCMFIGCSSLTAAPDLPATTLATSCYQGMFQGCTSLTVAPELKAKTLANGCYRGMFGACTSLTTAPTLKAKTLFNNCYRNMFNGCTNLNAVTCLATYTSATDCTKDWLSGAGTAANEPKLYVVESMTSASWNNGIFSVTAIPSGWTVENDVQVVPTGTFLTRGTTPETSNTWTLEHMLPGNVMLIAEYYDETGLVWKQGETELANGATVNCCEGFAFTMPTLYNPNSSEVTGITYSSSDQTVATIDETTGAITVVADGETTIKAHYPGSTDNKYTVEDLTFTLIVSKPVTLTVTQTAHGTVTVEGASKGDAAGAVFEPQNYQGLDNVTVLHVGDTFVTENGDYWTELNAGIRPGKNVTCQVVRAKSEGGSCVADKNGTNYAISYSGYCIWFGNITGNSDGLKVTYNRTEGNTKYYTLDTNIPAATSNAIDNGNGTYTVIPNSEITLKAEADEGYHLTSWSNNAAVTEDCTQTLTISQATTISATFAENEYNVTFVAKNDNTIKDGGATVTVANVDKTGSLTHNQDGSKSTLKNVMKGQTVKLKAATGYKLRKVEVKNLMKSLTVTINGSTETVTLYYDDNEKVGEAIANHASMNAGWKVVTEIGGTDDDPSVRESVYYKSKKLWFGSALLGEAGPDAPISDQFDYVLYDVNN